MKTPQTAAGFLLIELMVGLGIVAIITTIALTLVSAEVRSLLASRRTREEIDALLTARNYLRLTVERLDLHTFPILPRIQHGAPLRFADGSTLILARQFTPSSGSDAISYAVVISRQIMEVVGSPEDLHEPVVACLRFHGASPARELEYIGVNTDHELLPLLGHLGPRAGNCYRLALRPTKSALLPPAPQDARPPLLLLPLDPVFTLYLTERGGLRYLATKGEEIIEHQPISAPLSAMRISLTPVAEQAIWSLSATLSSPTGSPLSYSSSHLLGRSALDDLLFNFGAKS